MRRIEDFKESDWATVWAVWAATFAVAEYYAIKSGKAHAPLSHHLRRTLGIRKKPVYRYAGQVALGGGVIWLVDHLYRAIES